MLPGPHPGLPAKAGAIINKIPTHRKGAAVKMRNEDPIGCLYLTSEMTRPSEMPSKGTNTKNGRFSSNLLNIKKALPATTKCKIAEAASNAPVIVSVGSIRPCALEFNGIVIESFQQWSNNLD
jgi:hypothetical protein